MKPKNKVFRVLQTILQFCFNIFYVGERILWTYFEGRWLKMKRTWFNIYISAWCRLLWGSILLFWCFRWVFMWWRVAAVLICSGQTHAPHVKSALYPPDSHVSNQKLFFDKRKFIFFYSFLMNSQIQNFCLKNYTN